MQDSPTITRIYPGRCTCAGCGKVTGVAQHHPCVVIAGSPSGNGIYGHAACIGKAVRDLLGDHWGADTPVTLGD